MHSKEKVKGNKRFIESIKSKGTGENKSISPLDSKELIDYTKVIEDNFDKI